MPIRRLALSCVGLIGAVLAGCSGQSASSASAASSSTAPPPAHSGEPSLGRLTLRESDLPPGWRAGGVSGAPTGLSAYVYSCVGLPAPRETGVAASPVFSGSSDGGQLLAQSGATRYASSGAAVRALSALGARRAPRCLGGLVDAEVAPGLPRGVQIASTSLSALHPASVAYPYRGYDVSIEVRGDGVSTEIRGAVQDERRAEVVVGLTTLGLGKPFPPALEQSLLGHVTSRLSSTST